MGEPHDTPIVAATDTIATTTSETAAPPPHRALSLATPEYAVAFVFGAIVIAVFAHRQLETITSRFPRVQGIVLKLATASLLGGRRSFRKAYICYLIVLEALYVIACTVQPVIGALFPGGEPKADLFKAPEWPLAASLLIVWFSPNFPLAVQLEETFRRLAHKLAGIPEYLFAIIDRIEEFEIPQTLSGDKQLKEFSHLTDEVVRVATVFGVPGASIPAFRNDMLTSLLFDYWLFSRTGDEIWSQEVKGLFIDVSEYLGPRTTAFRKDLPLAISESTKTQFYKKVSRLPGFPPRDSTIDHPDLVDHFLSTQADKDDLTAERDHIVNRFSKLADDASDLASQLQAVMALFIVNDRSVRVDKHTEFRKLLQHALTAKPRTIWNALLLAALVPFVCVFVVSIVTRIVENYLPGVQPEARVALSVLARNSALTAYSDILLFGMSMLVAAFIRTVKVDAGTWVRFSLAESSFPVVQYGAVLFWCSIVAGIASMANYLVTQYLMNVSSAYVVETFLKFQAPLRLAYAVSGGLLGCMLCAIVDRWEKRNLQPRDLWTIPLGAATFITLYGSVVLLIFDLTAVVLYEAVGLFIFSLVSLICMIAFLRRIRERRRTTRPRNGARASVAPAPAPARP